MRALVLGGSKEEDLFGLQLFILQTFKASMLIPGDGDCDLYLEDVCRALMYRQSTLVR